MILTLPFFFEDSGLLPVPENFHPNTVHGRRYNVKWGTGGELWDAVRERRQMSHRSQPK